MYFLRWLYREANPMMLVLGIVLLYLLLNIALRPDHKESESETVVLAPVAGAVSNETVTKKAPVKSADIDNEAVVSAVSPAVTVTEVAEPVAKAQSSATSDKLAENAQPVDLSAESVSIDANQAADASVFDRVFKRPASARMRLLQSMRSWWVCPKKSSQRRSGNLINRHR